MVDNDWGPYMLSILTRISLIGLIVYGGYMVIGEQRIARHCENEVKSLEKNFEAMLDPQSTTLKLCSLNPDPLFFSWLYHVPANHSVAIQIQTKASESTSTLLRIPSQPTGHYGIIDLQFNTEGTSPPVINEYKLKTGRHRIAICCDRVSGKTELTIDDNKVVDRDRTTISLPLESHLVGFVQPTRAKSEMLLRGYGSVRLRADEEYDPVQHRFGLQVWAVP